MLSTVEAKKQQNIANRKHFQTIYVDFSSTAYNEIAGLSIIVDQFSLSVRRWWVGKHCSHYKKHSTEAETWVSWARYYRKSMVMPKNWAKRPYHYLTSGKCPFHRGSLSGAFLLPDLTGSNNSASHFSDAVNSEPKVSELSISKKTQ